MTTIGKDSFNSFNKQSENQYDIKGKNIYGETKVLSSSEQKLEALKAIHGSEKSRIPHLERVIEISKFATTLITSIGSVMSLGAGLALGAVAISSAFPFIGPMAALWSIAGAVTGYVGVSLLTYALAAPFILAQKLAKESLLKATPNFDSIEELYKNLDELSKFGVNKKILKAIIVGHNEFISLKNDMQDLEIMKNAQLISLERNQKNFEKMEKIIKENVVETIKKLSVNSKTFEENKAKIIEEGERQLKENQKEKHNNIKNIQLAVEELDKMKSTKQGEINDILLDIKKVADDCEKERIDSDYEIYQNQMIKKNPMVIQGKDYMSPKQFEKAEKDKIESRAELLKNFGIMTLFFDAQLNPQWKVS